MTSICCAGSNIEPSALWLFVLPGLDLQDMSVDVLDTNGAAALRAAIEKITPKIGIRATHCRIIHRNWWLFCQMLDNECWRAPCVNATILVKQRFLGDEFSADHDKMIVARAKSQCAAIRRKNHSPSQELIGDEKLFSTAE
ncbi:MAG: hypothetical protein KDD78_13060 [Caldilineaceae bacterium]|nr:hypothetical protein [Caldilineaceae bacterium]